jgi:hypothetical protein
MRETTSYRPDPILVGFWMLICSPPALVTGYLFAKAPSSSNLAQFAWTLVFLLLPLLFASRFRATFTETEFVYRRWGPTIRVPYSEIERIDVTNVTPVSEQPVGAFIVTKRGRRLAFWLKLFPREAVDRFCSLAS